MNREATNLEYGVHLMRCTGFHCRCPNLAEKICSDLQRRNIIVINGFNSYPVIGLISESWMNFCRLSQITIIPICSDAEGYRDFVRNSVHFGTRFCEVLSENVTVIPDFLRDFPITHLYNSLETVVYRNFIESIDGLIISDSLRTFTEVPGLPDNLTPSTYPSRPLVTENLTSSDRSSVCLTDTLSDTYDSQYSEVYNDETDNDTFVRLPLQEIISTIDDDSGAVARRKCCHLSSTQKKEFERLLSSTKLHSILNSTDKRDGKSSDIVLFIIHTFSTDKLDRSLSEAVDLLKCYNNNIVINHCIEYMKCKLFRWQFRPNEDEDEDLKEAEIKLLDCLSSSHLSTVLPHIISLYVLCVALLTTKGHPNSGSKRSSKYITEVGQRLHKMLVKSGVTLRPVIMSVINCLVDSTRSRQEVSALQSALREFNSSLDEPSLTTLKSLLKKLVSRSPIRTLLDIQKPHRVLVRLITIKGIVSCLKDGHGVGPEPLRTQYAKQLIELLDMSLKETQSFKEPWRNAVMEELHSLLFHKNSDVRKFVGNVEIIRHMTPEKCNELHQKNISLLFSAAALTFKKQIPQLPNLEETEDQWQFYLAQIGGTAVMEADIQLVSVIYFRPCLKQMVKQNSHQVDSNKPLRYFQTELGLLDDLGKHPLVVQMLAFHTSTDVFMYVLDTPISVTLQDHLMKTRNAKQSLSPLTLSRIATQMLEAIAFCHSKGVLHRAIRTCSFYFIKARSGDRLKLGKFGLAHRLHEGSPPTSDNMFTTLSEEESVDVTTLWCSPETLRERKTSKESDMWSVGLTLLELYTHGSWPYSTWLMENRFQNVINWVSLYGIQPIIPRNSVPPLVSDEILACLDIDPSRRPTIGKLLQTFRDIHKKEQGREFKERLTVKRPKYPDLCPYQAEKNWIADKGLPMPFDDGLNSELLTIYRKDLSTELSKVPKDGPTFHNFSSSGVIIKEYPVFQHSKHELTALSSGFNKSVHGLSLIHHDGHSIMWSRWNHSQARNLRTFILQTPVINEEIKDMVMSVFLDVLSCLIHLHKEGFVHRDICARNILVDPVAREGCLYRMARARQFHAKPGEVREYIEDPTTQGHFMNRHGWSAPEVLRDGVYSTASDVFMFAATVWEVFRLIDDHGKNAVTPFQEKSVETIILHLENSSYLPKPVSCPEYLYKVLSACWNPTRRDRPSMESVKKSIEQERFVHVDDVRYRFHFRGQDNRLAASHGNISREFPRQTEARPRTALLPIDESVPVYFDSVYTSNVQERRFSGLPGKLTDNANRGLSKSLASFPESFSNLRVRFSEQDAETTREKTLQIPRPKSVVSIKNFKSILSKSVGRKSGKHKDSKRQRSYTDPSEFVDHSLFEEQEQPTYEIIDYEGTLPGHDIEETQVKTVFDNSRKMVEMRAQSVQNLADYVIPTNTHRNMSIDLDEDSGPMLDISDLERTNGQENRPEMVYENVSYDYTPSSRPFYLDLRNDSDSDTISIPEYAQLQ